MGKKTRNQDVKTKIDSSMFGTESIGKILLYTAPPVMLAQLIQALYNIVDSYFVGKFSANGLTALSGHLSGTAGHYGAGHRHRRWGEHPDGPPVCAERVRSRR